MKQKATTLDFLAAHTVFSLDDAARRLHVPRRALLERLTYHERRGRLRRLTRGVYVTVPLGTHPRNVQPDPILVAATTRPDALFSHHSALELLGVAHSAWGRVTAFTTRPRSSLQVGTTTVSLLPDPAALSGRRRTTGTRTVDRTGTLLRTTGPERTLVEGFHRPARVGGLEELANSARAFAALDLDLLRRILAAYGSRTLHAAVGWFLESHRSTFGVTDDVLGRLERQRPRAPQYLPRSARGGTFVRRWNLILPAPLVGRGRPDEP